jgi:hypothetical protein
LVEKPIGVYLNWASYDELSDQVELTETLALTQLDALLRLRNCGVQFDYYVMDAFWFAKDGGYREWRKPHWPQGPDRWLETCLKHGVKPGLWLGANNPAWMQVIPEWQDSFDPQTGCMCCFYGGFLSHYMETLELWYQRGVRLFKFDFSDFSAAPPGIKEALLPSEIRAANITAFRGALKAFRRRHPDLVLLAYNGFEERTIQNSTDEPAAKVVDGRWFEVFDSIYCGDARPADIPTMNFWRSKDIYSDHMVRRYQQNDLPLARIDNAGFMIGTTGTCYFRGLAAWRGMLILSLARGGRVNTYYGNLDLLSDQDGQWFAALQGLFFRLHITGQMETFGGIPGQGEPYGSISRDSRGALITVVNPSQQFQQLKLPVSDPASLLFTDTGFQPIQESNQVTLGAEQMALFGTGEYAAFNFGHEPDVRIPETITRVENVQWMREGEKAVCAEVALTAPARLRIVLEQRNAQGRAVRTTGGSPPKGQSLGQLLSIEVTQGSTTLPLQTNYDKVIWSGLSWGVGEVLVEDITQPVIIRCASREKSDITLHGALYIVAYR